MSLVSDGGTIFSAPYSSNNTTLSAFTFFAWVKYPTTITGSQTHFVIANTAANSAGIIKTGAANRNAANYQDDSTNTKAAQEVAAPLANTWEPLCGIFSATNNVTLVTPSGTVSNNITVGTVGAATWNQFQFLGRQTSANGGAATNFFASGGMLAECAMWNTALSTADANNLVFEQYNPGIVRRDRLMVYLPLRLNAQDYGPLHLPFVAAGTQGATFSGDHPILDQALSPTKTFLFGAPPPPPRPGVKSVGADIAPGSAIRAFSVTPSDSTVFTTPTRYIWVGGAGNLAVLMNGDTAPVTMIAVKAGARLELSVQKVMLTNTTATNVVGFY